MRFSRLKIFTTSIVLFFGCQTSVIAADNTTDQKAGQQPAAQSTAKAPSAAVPPQPAWQGYYPHRPYYRPYRRRGSGSGFGFGSGSGPSFGSHRGPGWDDWGRDPFFDDPFRDDPYFGRDPWRRNDSGSGFGFGSGSGPSWGSGSGPSWGSRSGPGWGSRSGPRFYDRGRGPRDWDSGGMGFGW